MRQYIPYSDRPHTHHLYVAPMPSPVACKPLPQGAKLVSLETARTHLWENFEIHFSRATADKLRRDGKLVIGAHYRVLPSGAVRYHMPALEQYFGV